MKETCPSRTALQVAMRRAAHQILDDPKVFDDPLALRILGAEDAESLQARPDWPAENPISHVLRASLAARSRFAEEELETAVRRGVQQYVVLGAGLDTFAYRNPYPESVLRVFEVDSPAVQTWKHAHLEETGIPIPPNLTFAPVDFETGTLDEGLGRVGFDVGKPAFFSWLGVTLYLTDAAITATLRFAASLPVDSGIVFDYMISPSLLSPESRRAFEVIARSVEEGGEPFRSFFDPASLRNGLTEMGFGHVVDMGPEEINARYFQGRTDKLKAGTLARFISARV